MTALKAMLDFESMVNLLSLFILLALAAWTGRKFSIRRSQEEVLQDEHVKIVLGATLSIFGLLIGFLLSFAISGYNMRLGAEEKEAMALGNAFQRATLLQDQPAQAKMESMLNQYLDARIEFYSAPTEDQRDSLRQASRELHSNIWMYASEQARQAPNMFSASLMDACNQLYVAQQETMASWRHQIPLVAWMILMVFGVCSNFLVGYHMYGGKRKLNWLLVVPCVTALALFMILEIDVPGKGMIHVAPDNLQDLRAAILHEHLLT